MHYSVNESPELSKRRYVAHCTLDSTIEIPSTISELKDQAFSSEVILLFQSSFAEFHVCTNIVFLSWNQTYGLKMIAVTTSV